MRLFALPLGLLTLGCSKPLVEVEMPRPPAAEVTVKMVNPPVAEAPQNPKLICKWQLIQGGEGLALVDGVPQNLGFGELQAGGVVFEYEEQRRMQCHRLDTEMSGAPPADDIQLVQKDQ